MKVNRNFDIKKKDTSSHKLIATGNIFKRFNHNVILFEQKQKLILIRNFLVYYYFCLIDHKNNNNYGFFFFF